MLQPTSFQGYTSQASSVFSDVSQNCCAKLRNHPHLIGSAVALLGYGILFGLGNLPAPYRQEQYTALVTSTFAAWWIKINPLNFFEQTQPIEGVPVLLSALAINNYITNIFSNPSAIDTLTGTLTSFVSFKWTSILSFFSWYTANLGFIATSVGFINTFDPSVRKPIHIPYRFKPDAIVPVQILYAHHNMWTLTLGGILGLFTNAISGNSPCAIAGDSPWPKLAIAAYAMGCGALCSFIISPIPDK